MGANLPAVIFSAAQRCPNVHMENEEPLVAVAVIHGHEQRKGGKGI